MLPDRDLWSLSLGRWGGIRVRVHIFFLLFATFTVFLAWQDHGESDGLALLAILCVAILFVSVLIHELAHFNAALRCGGHPDTIVIGPLGGMHPVSMPGRPQAEFWVALAGPLISLGICLLCLVAIALRDLQAIPGILHPLAPEHLIAPERLSATSVLGTGLRLFCWINWWLFVLNLIPAFPFDGGQLCLASVQVAKPAMSREQAVATVAMLARVVSVGLLLAAIVLHDAVSGGPLPTWLPLVLLAIFVFFSARVEEVQARQPEEEEEMFGYDFSQGYTSLERSSTRQAKPEQRPSWFARMLDERRERRQQRQQEREAAEEKQMDEILQRLHAEGQESLTPAERALLKRVSARYRSKR